MIEDHIYIYNANGLEFINVRGIFEDPEDLAGYDCDGTDCYDANSDYPIPMDMIQIITEGIASKELQMLAGSKSDTTNDSAQDSGSLPRPSRPSAE